jgi:hypothetical protein
MVVVVFQLVVRRQQQFRSSRNYLTGACTRKFPPGRRFPPASSRAIPDALQFLTSFSRLKNRVLFTGGCLEDPHSPILATWRSVISILVAYKCPVTSPDADAEHAAVRYLWPYRQPSFQSLKSYTMSGWRAKGSIQFHVWRPVKGCTRAEFSSS